MKPQKTSGKGLLCGREVVLNLFCRDGNSNSNQLNNQAKKKTSATLIRLASLCSESSVSEMCAYVCAGGDVDDVKRAGAETWVA